MKNNLKLYFDFIQKIKQKIIIQCSNYKEFKNINESVAWGEKHFGNWLKDYHLEGQKRHAFDQDVRYVAFSYYCGDYSRPINQYLRFDHSISKKVKYYISIIKQELNKFYINENIITYRILSEKALILMSNGKIKKGTELIEKGFLSTGLVYEEIKLVHKDNYVLQILVNSGTHGIYLDFISNRQNEQEVLFLPCKLKVISIYKYDNKKFYKCIMIE